MLVVSFAVGVWVGRLGSRPQASAKTTSAKQTSQQPYSNTVSRCLRSVLFFLSTPTRKWRCASLFSDAVSVYYYLLRGVGVSPPVKHLPFSASLLLVLTAVSTFLLTVYLLIMCVFLSATPCARNFAVWTRARVGCSVFRRAVGSFRNWIFVLGTCCSCVFLCGKFGLFLGLLLSAP